MFVSFLRSHVSNTFSFLSIILGINLINFVLQCVDTCSQDLVQFVMTTRYEGLQHGGLTVLVTLSSDIGVINFDYSAGVSTYQLLYLYQQLYPRG